VNRFFLRSCAMVLVLAAASFGQSGQSWKGFYVGANVGGVKSNSDAFTYTAFSPTGYFATTSIPAIAAVGAPQRLDPSGFTGGGQFGYNFQGGHWVLGFEADFGGMSLDSTKTGSATYPCCAPTAFTVTQSVNTSWLITARPRLGITHGPVMLYGTGGLQVGRRWSVKGEYLYANFGQVATTSTNLTAFTPAIPFPTNIFVHKDDLSANMFRFGFNYRF